MSCIHKALSIIILFFASCSAELTPTVDDLAGPTLDIPKDAIEEHVEVTEVRVTESSGQFSFSVTLKSPDTGCDQYADWWEIITPDSMLLQRRILTHSHVNEQPFTRSGGNLSLDRNQTIIIRGHMNNLSYGRLAMSGSIEEGFSADTLPKFFAESLAQIEPLPSGCAF